MQVTRYAAGRHMERHCDGRARVSVVVSGALRESAGRYEVDAGPLSIAVKSPDVLHATRFGPEGACVASIDIDAISDSEWTIPRWRWSTENRLRAELRAFIAAIVELRAAPEDPDAVDGLREACLVLLDRLKGVEPIRDAGLGWLRGVRDRIDCAPEQAISVCRLARDAGVSPTHLTRCFKAVYGCTVVDHRKRQRVRSALQQLTRPGAELVDVALRAGFHDQAHFTRQFRAVTGTTPGTWRQYLLRN